MTTRITTKEQESPVIVTCAWCGKKHPKQFAHYNKVKYHHFCDRKCRKAFYKANGYLKGQKYNPKIKILVEYYSKWGCNLFGKLFISK